MIDTPSVLLATFVILWLTWYIKYRNHVRSLAKFGGPRVLPILGNALDLSSATKVLPSLTRYNKEFNGKNYRIFVGAQPFLIINDAKDVECILSSSVPIKKLNSYRFLYRWLGTGLLTSDGNKWRKHRKIITPAFHFKILENFVDVFNSCSQIFIEKLSSEIGKDSFDIYPYVTRCTLDIICETAMGTSVHAQEDKESKYVKAVNRMVALIAKRTFSPILQYDPLYKFSLPAFREHFDLRILHGFTNDVIKRRKLELFPEEDDISNSKISMTNTEDLGSSDGLGIKKRKAFLDLLLEYSVQDPSFTDEHIREEVDTFMFEGHDTTATSIAFALYSLAMNQNVQDKAFKELRDLFSDDPTRSTTFRDLQDMKYLEMVIKESLRLYATVPVFGRELTEDFDLNGVILPKGVMVAINAYGIHRNPRYYKDPEVYDPERFTTENLTGKNPYMYIPFSAGPRNCIGQKFAMLEMKSTISYVLRHYKLLPSIPKIEIVLRCDVVLKSDTGVHVKFEKREWKEDKRR